MSVRSSSFAMPRMACDRHLPGGLGRHSENFYAAEDLSAGKGGDDPRLFTRKRRAEAIPKYITGKFCEHLGNNLFLGMDAPKSSATRPSPNTRSGTGPTSPDGVTVFQSDAREIARQLRQQAQRVGWPEGELDRLVEAREHGLGLLVAPGRKQRGGADQPGHRATQRPGTAGPGGRAGQRASPSGSSCRCTGCGSTRSRFSPARPTSLPSGVALFAPDTQRPCTQDNRAGIVGRLERVAGCPGRGVGMPRGRASRRPAPSMV